MSSEISISLKGIGKAYSIYKRPEDRLKQILWRSRRRFYDEFWAVRGVHLDVYRGETVGIVGRNGSGKSTLLQLICGTLQPTCGELLVRGRVAALLELGAGFNPEFTGRENVFMNAAILGLTTEEIEARYDAILAFADIGVFIGQPVKSYSSGMYARLAFAVAINVDPDILVVDEALSVGDEAFQRKCFSRIERIRDSGATILFVSHSATSVIELCNRAVLMDAGERILTGQPKAVVAKYQRLLYAPAEQATRIRDEIRALDAGTLVSPVAAPEGDAPPTAAAHGAPRDESHFEPNLKSQSTVEYVPRGAQIRNVRILNSEGKHVNVLSTDCDYVYAYEVVVKRPSFNVRCGMMLKSPAGVDIGGFVSHPLGGGLEYVEASTLLQVRFGFKAALTPGTYFLNAGVLGWQDGEEVYMHRLLDVLLVRVKPNPEYQVTGYVDFSTEPRCEIAIHALSPPGDAAEPASAG